MGDMFECPFAQMWAANRPKAMWGLLEICTKTLLVYMKGEQESKEAIAKMYTWQPPKIQPESGFPEQAWGEHVPLEADRPKVVQEAERPEPLPKPRPKPARLEPLLERPPKAKAPEGFHAVPKPPPIALMREIGGLPIYMPAKDIRTLPEYQNIRNWPKAPPAAPAGVVEADWPKPGEGTMAAAAAAANEPEERYAAADVTMGPPTEGRLPEGERAMTEDESGHTTGEEV